MVELAFSVHEQINIGTNYKDSKTSFKSAISNGFPNEILNRKKSGFNAPVYDWIDKGHTQLKNRITNPSHPIINKLFDIDKITKVWNNPKLRCQGNENLFMIYIMDKWVEIHD